MPIFSMYNCVTEFVVVVLSMAARHLFNRNGAAEFNIIFPVSTRHALAAGAARVGGNAARVAGASAGARVTHMH